VKEAVAGWGGAPKEQVQRMIQIRLGLSEPPRPADAADAAALALCHLARAPLDARVSSAARQSAARTTAVGGRP
jgi:crossover junction endodeoxyribonuclease RuvC